MQYPFTDKLSQYQKAVLNEMGVQLWRANQSIDAEDIEQLIVEDAQQAETANQQTAPEVLSVPNKVLFLADTAQLSSPVMRDICLALDIQQDDIVAAEVEKLGSYADYRFAWQVGEKVNLNEKMLTTPADSLSPEAKKQLWQQLQTLISATDL